MKAFPSLRNFVDHTHYEYKEKYRGKRVESRPKHITSYGDKRVHWLPNFCAATVAVEKESVATVDDLTITFDEFLEEVVMFKLFHQDAMHVLLTVGRHVS